MLVEKLTGPLLGERVQWLLNGGQPLFNDYFFLLHVALLGAVGLVWVFRSEYIDYVDRLVFLLFGGLMVLFAALRPFGSAMDDHGYQTMFEQICELPDCSLRLVLQRDSLWKFLVAGLKVIHPKPEVMLWLSACFLSVKLWVIYQCTRWRSLALLSYASIFYLVDDITALRYSAAAAFYMLAILALGKTKMMRASGLIGVSGLLHVQGFIGFLLLPALCFINEKKMLLALLLVPMVLTLVGLHPGGNIAARAVDLPILKWLFNPTGISVSIFKQYVAEIQRTVKSMPFLIPPTLLLVSGIIFRISLESNRIVLVSGVSVALGSMILWFYAFDHIAQFRLSNMFLLPLVIIMGNAPRLGYWIPVSMTLCFLYMLKYSVVRPMLFDDSHVFITEPKHGGVKLSYTDNCSPNCSYDMSDIKVTAVPEEGYVFDGWMGSCSGQKNPCHLGIYKSSMVSARFVEGFKLSIALTGDGAVTSDPKGIWCKPMCTMWAHKDSLVDLTRHSGGHGLEWSGECLKKIGNPCTIKMDADKTIYAHFFRMIPIRISLSGQGYITQEGNRLGCQNQCDLKLPDNRMVTFTAEAKPGYHFAGWSGVCSGAEPTCSFEVKPESSLTAKFLPDLPANEPMPSPH